MNGLARLRPALCLALFLAGSTVLSADTLIYRSGRKVQGKMIHINGFRMLFRLNDGREIAVPSGQVRRIVFDKARQPAPPKKPEPPPRRPEPQQPAARRDDPKPQREKPPRATPKRQAPARETRTEKAEGRQRPGPATDARRKPPRPAQTDRRRNRAPQTDATGDRTGQSGDGPRNEKPPELFRNESRRFRQGPDKILYARRPVQVTLAPGPDSDPAQAATIYYSMNDSAGGFSKYVAPFVLARTGFYHIRYYAVDAAGNREVLRHKKIYVDRTAPEISVDFHGPFHTDRAGVVFLSSPFVFVRATDADTGLAALRCRLAGEVQDLGTGGGVLSLPDKNTTGELVCQARDRVGNQGERTLHLHLDSEGPTVAWRSPENPGDMKSGRRVAFTVRDEASGIAALRVLVDDFPHELPVEARSFAPADYESKSGVTRSFAILAVDRAGNENRTPAIRLRIDRKPPVSEIKIAD